MKPTLPLLLALTLLLGCSTTPNGQPDQRLTTIAELAAYTGTSIYLLKHPEQRPAFVAARDALDVLVKDGNFDPAAFHQALQLLPIRELHSEEGTLIIGAAMILYDAYARDTIDLDRATFLLPVISATRNGLDRALGQGP